MPTPIQKNAQEIFDELLNKFDIRSKKGQILMTLGGISTVYTGKDAIGNLLQDWLAEWLTQNNYYFRLHTNSQEPPDFFLSPDDKTDLLEIKTFNADAGPAFDIANFDSYCTLLLTDSYKLDSDYLILSYKMDKGALSIKNLWLKKVWEISCATNNHTIKTQIKRGQIYNIRPATWYSMRTNFKTFATRKHFVKALAGIQNEFVQCKNYRTDWYRKVLENYKELTGNDL